MKQAQAKAEAGKQSPAEMFRSQTDKYSAFDDNVSSPPGDLVMYAFHTVMYTSASDLPFIYRAVYLTHQLPGKPLLDA